MDPARMFTESLTPRPELENGQDPFRKSRVHRNSPEVFDWRSRRGGQENCRTIPLTKWKVIRSLARHTPSV